MIFQLKVSVHEHLKVEKFFNVEKKLNEVGSRKSLEPRIETRPHLKSSRVELRANHFNQRRWQEFFFLKMVATESESAANWSQSLPEAHYIATQKPWLGLLMASRPGANPINKFQHKI